MAFSSLTSNAPVAAGQSTDSGARGAPQAAANADPLLQPFVRLRLEPASSGIGRGQIAAEILLRNRSGFAAYRPFLCLPWIGLNLSPARGWKIEDMTSIRRLRRFQQFSEAPLEAGAEAPCGSLFLPYRTGQGGLIEYSPGGGHRLASLPEFRIGCTCGAGNFPAFRADLVIAAESLRQVMAAHLSSGQRLP